MENYNKHEIRKRLDGSIYSECYLLNDKRHRTDGPAYITYNTNMSVRSIQYFINGYSHRLDGPAHIFYDSTGAITHVYYDILDKEVTKEQFYTTGFIDTFILENS